MKTQEPGPNLVNFEQFRNTGTRSVEVKANGIVFKATHRLAEDPSVDQEMTRLQMTLAAEQTTFAAAQAKLKALPEGPSSEREAIETDIQTMNDPLIQLRTSVTFNPRRIVCERISRQIVSWNVDLPLTFDGLFDCSLETETLQAIYSAVVNEPIVGEAS